MRMREGGEREKNVDRKADSSIAPLRGTQKKLIRLCRPFVSPFSRPRQFRHVCSGETASMSLKVQKRGTRRESSPLLKKRKGRERNGVEKKKVWWFFFSSSSSSFLFKPRLRSLSALSLPPPAPIRNYNRRTTHVHSTRIVFSLFKFTTFYKSPHPPPSLRHAAAGCPSLFGAGSTLHRPRSSSRSSSKCSS